MQPHPSPAVPRGALSRRIVGAAAVGVLSMGAAFAPAPAVATTRGLSPAATARESRVAAADPSTVALVVSAPSVLFGVTSTLTATVDPPTATGQVEFFDVAASGADAGNPVSLGTATVLAGTATLSRPLPAFGLNTLAAAYGGDVTSAASTSTAATVEVSAYPGQIIVTEFRQGAGGGNDTYVELYNTGPVAPLAGFVLSAFSGTVTTLPSTAGILPTGRYFLVTGTLYSHGAVAAADHVSSTLGTGGVRVLAPDTAGTRTDAAGPTSGYHLGTGLTEMTIQTTGTTGWAWARLQLAGAPRNTSDNASDFWLVYRSTTLIRGMQPTVGGSSPSNTTSPPPQNAGLQSTLLDPAVNASVEPNRAYTPAGAGGSPPGTLTIRRTVTNSTALAVSSLTIRVTALSQAFGAPLPGVATQPATHANLRVREPATTTSTVAMSNGTTVSVTNATINDPNLTTVGAGLNSALTVNLPDPLAPAASINVAVHFTVQTVGRFWFGYDVEAALTTPVPTNAAPTRQHSLLTGPRRSPHRISTLTTGQLRNETPPRRRSQAWAASDRG